MKQNWVKARMLGYKTENIFRCPCPQRLLRRKTMGLLNLSRGHLSFVWKCRLHTSSHNYMWYHEKRGGMVPNGSIGTLCCQERWEPTFPLCLWWEILISTNFLFLYFWEQANWVSHYLTITSIFTATSTAYMHRNTHIHICTCKQINITHKTKHNCEFQWTHW